MPPWTLRVPFGKPLGPGTTRSVEDGIPTRSVGTRAPLGEVEIGEESAKYPRPADRPIPIALATDLNHWWIGEAPDESVRALHHEEGTPS
jgi:hypothetical protein